MKVLISFPVNYGIEEIDVPAKLSIIWVEIEKLIKKMILHLL